MAMVTYLGQMVGQGQIHPFNAKVQSIMQLPLPTKKELMHFLGLVGYSCAF